MHEVGYWEGAIDEHTPCHPASMYGIAKMPYVRPRLCSHKNTMQPCNGSAHITSSETIYAVVPSSPNCCKPHMMASRPSLHDGKNKYDFINVDELARQISAAVSQREVTGIINCCTGKPISLAERVEQYIKDNDLNITLDYGAFPDRPYDSPGVWGDATKIHEILATR